MCPGVYGPACLAGTTDSSHPVSPAVLFETDTMMVGDEPQSVIQAYLFAGVRRRFGVIVCCGYQGRRQLVRMLPALGPWRLVKGVVWSGGSVMV